MKLHMLLCLLPRRKNRRGAAIVEATLLLPLFLIFWFGIIDWGIAFWIHETVVHRANSAVRWAVVNDFDIAKAKSKFLYDDPSASGDGSAWFSLTNPDVNVQLLGTSAGKDERVVMTVSNYQWMHFTPFFASRYLGRPIRVSIPIEDLKDGY